MSKKCRRLLLQALVDTVRFQTLVCRKIAFEHNRIHWNPGTACVSECVLKTLACRGLRAGPSKEKFLGGFGKRIFRRCPRTSHKLLQKPTLRCVWLLSVFIFGSQGCTFSPVLSMLSPGDKRAVSQKGGFGLSGVIRANRFARFARIR